MKTELQQGERDLCKSVLDAYAMFVREHQDELTLPQIVQLKHVFSLYEGICFRWKARRFYVVQETLNLQEYTKKIEEKTLPAKQ